MITSAKKEVQFIVEACKRVGVENVVISPGSRNAPFSIAFDEDPSFKNTILVDERSAGFYALGMALASKKPVVIVCTSGSAPLNYYPAIAEAFYQHLPLIVISADRPDEWTDQGDGQTIRQQNVFQNHIQAQSNFSPIHDINSEWFFLRKLSETLHEVKNGPVHLNVPLSEPLYETTNSPSEISSWLEIAEEDLNLGEKAIAQVKLILQASKKPMIVLGQFNGYSQNRVDLLNKLAEKNILIFSEHTSNSSIEKSVKHIDRTLGALNYENDEDLTPDLIIDLGDAVISKKVKRFLRAAKAKVIRFSPFIPNMDTYQNLIFSSKIDAEKALNYLVELSPYYDTSFAENWLKPLTKIQERHAQLSAEIGFSDFKTVQKITEKLKNISSIHFSNSSMIRYGLLMDFHKNVEVYCNRGTSGIDGSTSTFLGFALEKKDENHLFITGDLSFFYDSNALWNSNLPKNALIILVNNGGGDIFNIIPGPKTTNQHERIFTTKHQQTAKGLCENFGVKYSAVNTLFELELALSKEYFNGLQVIEVLTFNVNNSEILEIYFQKLK